MVSLPVSISPPFLVSLTFSLCLHEHLLVVCVRSCVQLCLCLYSEAWRARLMKGSGLVVFSWHGNSLAKPRKWTSSKLFQRGLVFVVPHSKTTWPHVTPPPSPPAIPILMAGLQQSVQGVGGRTWHDHAVHQTQMSSALCLKCFTWKHGDSTREAALREAVSNVLCGAEGVFWLSTCTHKCAYKCLCVQT